MHIKSYIISLFTLFVGSSAWTVENGHIFNEEGQQTNLRALSWFGFETQDFVVNGLWVHPLDWYLDIVKQNNINAIESLFLLNGFITIGILFLIKEL